ncbi:flippase, partial [bacterium]|nr:flippase [bacterium]
MSTANKIFTNTLWQVVIRIVNILVGVFSLAMITRILGQAGFGFYTTAMAFVQIFMIVVDLGLYLTLLREISTVKEQQAENKIVNNIFTIRVISSLLVIVLIPIIINFFPYSAAVKSGVVYFMWAFFFQSLISTLTAVFSKKLAMPKVALVDLFNKLLYAGFLVYLFFRPGGNLNEVLLSASVAHFIAFILFYFFLRKYVRLWLAWDFKYWKQIFHRTWPLAVTVVLNLLYFKADTLVLSAYYSPEDVGLYGAPYRVLEAVASFPHMFMSLILPLFTAAWVSKNMDKLKDTLQNSFDFFSIIVIGMIAGTWLISEPLMILLAGQEFAGSGAILNVLILATAMIFFGTLFTYLVVALQAQKQMIKYFLITAVIGIIGYFIFIPRFSYWGAAYMTLFVETMIVIFAYWVVRKNTKLGLNFKVFYKCLLAGLIALVLGGYMKEINIILA